MSDVLSLERLMFTSLNYSEFCTLPKEERRQLALRMNVDTQIDGVDLAELLADPEEASRHSSIDGVTFTSNFGLWTEQFDLRVMANNHIDSVCKSGSFVMLNMLRPYIDKLNMLAAAAYAGNKLAFIFVLDALKEHADSGRNIWRRGEYLSMKHIVQFNDLNLIKKTLALIPADMTFRRVYANPKIIASEILSEAVEINNLEIVKYAHKKGGIIDKVEFAFAKGYYDVFHYLEQNTARIDWVNVAYMCCLHRNFHGLKLCMEHHNPGELLYIFKGAIRGGDLEIIDYLIPKTGKPDRTNLLDYMKILQECGHGVEVLQRIQRLTYIDI